MITARDRRSVLETLDHCEGQKVSARDRRSALGTRDHYEGHKVSGGYRRSLWCSLHEVRELDA